MSVYNRIYNNMLELIQSGSWRIGEQIPSENFLKNHYGVNRLTLRKALDILANENLITKKKGSRAKVISRRAVYKVYCLTSLDDPVLKKKRVSIVINFTKKKSITSKNYFKDYVFEIQRCFFDNKEPAYIARGQVLVKSVPDLNEKIFSLQKYNNASLSEILVNKYNLKVYKQQVTSTSVLLSKDESEFFNVPRNSAGTKWVSFYFDNKNQLLFIDTEISLKKIEIEMINKQPNNDEKI